MTTSKLELQFQFWCFVTAVYLCGVVTGIFIRGCCNRFANRNSRNLSSGEDGPPMSYAIPLPLDNQGTTMDASPGFVDTVGEAETDIQI